MSVIKKTSKLAWQFVQHARRKGLSSALTRTKAHPVWQVLTGRSEHQLEKMGFNNPFKQAYAYAHTNFKPTSVEAVASVAIGYASQGNFFMKEIAMLIGSALQESGRQVCYFDEHHIDKVSDADLTLIVAPHEFFILGDSATLIPRLQQVNRLVMLNTEQAQTPWFAQAIPFLKQAKVIWDMNYQSAVLQRANYLPAFFLPLGYCESYQKHIFGDVSLERTTPLLSLSPSVTDAPVLAYQDRPIDILFVGTISERRRDFFAKNAGFFANYECFIYLPEGTQPFTETQAQTINFKQLAGLAQRSKIVLNIHRDEDRYLEWQRIVNLGALCGSLVVSETCDTSPALTPGLDYIDTPLSLIPHVCEYYLSAPDTAASFAQRALENIQSTQSLPEMMERLIAATLEVTK